MCKRLNFCRKEIEECSQLYCSKLFFFSFKKHAQDFLPSKIILLRKSRSQTMVLKSPKSTLVKKKKKMATPGCVKQMKICSRFQTCFQCFSYSSSINLIFRFERRQRLYACMLQHMSENLPTFNPLQVQKWRSWNSNVITIRNHGSG